MMRTTLMLVALFTWAIIAPATQAAQLFVSENTTSFGSSKIKEVSPSGSVSTFVTGFNSPVGLAFNSSGDLFVSDTNFPRTISKVTPAGVVSTFASFGAFESPWGIAFNASGNLFVAITKFSANDGTIKMVTPSGSVSTFASGFSNPGPLAFNSSGSLFVADTGTISRLTPFGIGSPFASGFSFITGLAFNSSGDLFVADAGMAKISKVTPSGSITTFVSSGLSQIQGITFDGTGNLFVANGGDGTIKKITSSGVVSTFASGFDQPSALAFQSDIASVPEPSTLVTAAIGTLGSIIFLARRRLVSTNEHF